MEYKCKYCNHVFVTEKPVSEDTCLRCLMNQTSPKYIALFGLLSKWAHIERRIYEFRKIGVSRKNSKIKTLCWKANIIKKRVMSMERESYSQILEIESKVNKFPPPAIPQALDVGVSKNIKNTESYMIMKSSRRRRENETYKS